jgi:hypothetical protein
MMLEVRPDNYDGFSGCILLPTSDKSTELWQCTLTFDVRMSMGLPLCSFGAELVLDVQHRDSQTQERHVAMDDVSDWWESIQSRHASQVAQHEQTLPRCGRLRSRLISTHSVDYTVAPASEQRDGRCATLLTVASAVQRSQISGILGTIRCPLYLHGYYTT